MQDEVTYHLNRERALLSDEETKKYRGAFWDHNYITVDRGRTLGIKPGYYYVLKDFPNGKILKFLLPVCAHRIAFSRRD